MSEELSQSARVEQVDTAEMVVASMSALDISALQKKTWSASNAVARSECDCATGGDSTQTAAECAARQDVLAAAELELVALPHMAVLGLDEDRAHDGELPALAPSTVASSTGSLPMEPQCAAQNVPSGLLGRGSSNGLLGRSSNMPEELQLAWRLVITHLEADLVALTLPQVCKDLGHIATESLVLASVLGCMPGSDAIARQQEETEILSAYPAGRFVAEGGFKKVYCVRNVAQRRTEAMGVMDLRSLREQGLENQLGTELWISFLVSQISLRGACPHFLRVYQYFQSASPPPSNDWGEFEAIDQQDETVALDLSETTDSEEEAEMDEPKSRRNGRKPAVTARKVPNNKQCYQYVLMQLAEFGDMEEACKKESNAAWPVSRLPEMLFQMLFSMYSAQVTSILTST
ncbi:hypothetical protein AB1Y20_004340 [Prymnesium parvum]|uniref:Uncharacterized protein n=1 Tax=Prymnesium parvum TaxID=97485 RepID=A0AB34IYX3_PRYPA